MTKKEKYKSLAELNYETQTKLHELLKPWKEYGYESTLEGGLQQLKHEITDIVRAAKIDYEVSEGIISEDHPVNRMIESLENRFSKIEQRIEALEEKNEFEDRDTLKRNADGTYPPLEKMI